MIGTAKRDLDTPVLMVDLDKVDRNIAYLSSYLRERRVNWRPHTKGVKVPAIAHMEIAAGAIGVTCAKLGEAEVMANAGIRDILVANQVVGQQKVIRLANLRRRADVIVAVDSAENVREIDAAARDNGVRIRVLVEVNVGMNRCGVRPGEPVVELAKIAASCPGLAFAGVMGWEGHIGAIEDMAERQRASDTAIGMLTRSAEMCRQAGLSVPIVSCAGTMTYMVSAGQPGITEVQAGGGVLCDLRYQHDGVQHEIALSVMSTVVSRPDPRRIVTDAGFKTMSFCHGIPQPIGIEGVSSVLLSAEHGQIELDQPSATPRVGDKVEFYVGYGDSTVCLHDEMYGIRNDKLEVIWPIQGRGKIR